LAVLDAAICWWISFYGAMLAMGQIGCAMLAISQIGCEMLALSQIGCEMLAMRQKNRL